MTFSPTAVAGVFLIESPMLRDERGWFARSWCAEEFAAQGLNTEWPQGNTCYNATAGILRGMHLQLPPHEEIRLVRCVHGLVLDVIVDLRRDSPTYLASVAVELSGERMTGLYVPKGCAHGYLTLADHSTLVYQMSIPYHPESGYGFAYDDPAFGLAWPRRDAYQMSQRDQSFAPYDPEQFLFPYEG